MFLQMRLSVFFFFNIRDVFHKILCDFAGPEAVQQ